ncbi:hypothetical protein PHAVU_009G205600 [Phaseolus vulgaris]|uniref:Uncharacterized protein n=1 Tax=Phaseolus vulgaris TaxID=3885 RepID=V7AXU3_PHAVU|nr:hypothetical protein PHAVU_009G205600g [Phaseolus vulgaris]ESW10394.1 hypothetical protein PHAVU_009G205600g [Phaseolus vulgaris]
MPVVIKPHHTADTDAYEKQEDGSFTIVPKGLNIVWGNDSRYWKIPDDGPAELIQASWLEVTCVVPITVAGKYKVSFNVRVKENGFGWNGTPVRVMARSVKNGRYKYETDRLSPGENITIPSNSLVINVKHTPTDLHFGLYEVWTGKWKGGLEVIKALVQPVVT